MMYYLGPPRAGDAPALYEIESASGMKDAWSRDQVNLLVAECSKGTPAMPPADAKGHEVILALVAYESDVQASAEPAVVGYVVWVDDHSGSRILSMAVEEARRGRGLGRMMLEAVEDLVQCRMHAAQTRRWLVATTRERDLKAQLFLKACRYRCYRIVRDAFPKVKGKRRAEDGYAFRKRLTRCPEDRALKFYGMSPGDGAGVVEGVQCGEKKDGG